MGICTRRSVLRYLLHLLPVEKDDPVDLEGKLKLEYYKLQKTFEGEIKLENLDGEYIPAKQKGGAGKQEKHVDEILDRVNEQYKVHSLRSTSYHWCAS